MPDTARYVIIGLILFLTQSQQGLVGFGSTILALPFVTLLIGLERAVPVMVVQAWVLALLIAAESWRHIDWREYRTIVGLAATGLPVGLWAGHALPEYALRWILAGLMLAVGVQGLVREMRRPAPAAEEASGAPGWAKAFLPLGGLIQGAFGAGGPLFAIYATRALTRKSAFRATLSLLWLTLNTILIASFVALGRLDPHLLGLNAAYLPGTILGMWLGTHVHYRINEQTFRQIIYCVLLAAAVVFAWSLLSSS